MGMSRVGRDSGDQRRSDGSGGERGPTATTNGQQERGNRSWLSVVVDTRSRCQPDATVGGMADEAKALGKAEGYADVGTLIRMVGVLVGVDTS